MRILGTIDFIDGLGHDKFYKIVMDCCKSPARLAAVQGDYHQVQGSRQPFLGTTVIELHKLPREFERVMTLAMERQLHDLVGNMEYFKENFMATDEDMERDAVKAVEGHTKVRSTPEQRWAQRFSSSMEVLAYPQYRSREVSLDDLHALRAKLLPHTVPAPMPELMAAE